MKKRTIGGLVLALAVALGACAPPGQGGGSSDEPSSAPSLDAAESMGAESMGAEPSAEASEAAPAPSYDYDY
jgi:hypothetical protein